MRKLVGTYVLVMACAPAAPGPSSGAGVRADAGTLVPLEAGVSGDVGARGDASHGDAAQALDVQKHVDAGPVDPCVNWVERLQLDQQMMANPGFGRRRLERPIVLHHGMAGFRQMGPLEYFSDAPSHLRGLGYEVYLTQVPPIEGSEVRAAELEEQLRCINHVAGSDGVHLIGHSQGGVEGRLVASGQGDEALIHTLTTLATPHRGSAAADAFLSTPAAGRGVLTQALMQIYSGLAGRPDAEADLHQQMVELGTEFMAEFNARVPDHPDVVYRSWSGRSVRNRFDRDRASEACDDAVHPNPEGRDVVDPLFALFLPTVAREQGPNDGLVAVSSARWGRFMGCVPADHLDEVGMMWDPAPQRFSGFSYLNLFETMAQDLATP